MIRKMQFLAYLGAVSAALFAHNAHAIDATVGAEAQFRTALTLTVSQTIDFTPGARALEYTDAANITGGTDYISMGTDGSLVANGTRLSTAYSSGQRGELAFTGDNASVSISCNTDTVLANGAGTILLPLSNVELDVAATIGAVGAAVGAGDYDCAGVGTTPYTYTITGNAGVIAVGGRLEGVANMNSAVYATTNTNGVPVSVRVVYGP